MSEKKYICYIYLLLLLLFSDTAFCIDTYGKIINNLNNPVAYAIVSFTQNGKEVARSITGNDGLFYIRNLPIGTYIVIIISGKNKYEKPDIKVKNSSKMFEFII